MYEKTNICAPFAGGLRKSDFFPTVFGSQCFVVSGGFPLQFFVVFCWFARFPVVGAPIAVCLFSDVVCFHFGFPVADLPSVCFFLFGIVFFE